MTPVRRPVHDRQGQISSCSGRDEPFGIEDGFGFEHEIDGAGQFDGQDGVGLELVVQPRLEALRQRADDQRIAFGDRGGFAEGPAQIGLPSLAPRRPLIFPALATVPLTSRQ